jgi:predicted  nucleic acid-binding Zn-ribbon protein
MLQDLEELIGVQVCDGEIARLSAELAALPKRIAGLEAELARERAALKAAEDGLKAEEAARRRQESDVSDLQAKIKKYRAQVDTVQNDAQYKALLLEISFAESNISKLEDAELESLERTDALTAAKQKAAVEVEHYEALLARELESAAQTQTVHEGRLQVLRTERARLRTLISEQALANYDRIFGAKKAPLAAAWDQKCSACQMMVRPQRWNDLRNADGEEPINCESCGRRLYYDVGHGTDAAKEQVALRRLRELG